MHARQLLRTTSDNTDFQQLVAALDADLRIRDGDDHAFYAQFNGIAQLNQVVVAYQNGEPVGCGAIKLLDAETVEVKRMYVVPEHRNKGIASDVLKELEQWAVLLNGTRCILETGKKQPEAIQLYPKNGYRRIPNYGQYAGIADSVCFEKLIG